MNMIECSLIENEALMMQQASASREKIEHLQQQGAQRFDPVQFRFIEILAKRISHADDSSRLILENKLAVALANYKIRFQKAQADAAIIVERICLNYPDSAKIMHAFFAESDFNAIKRYSVKLTEKNSAKSLAELSQIMDQDQFALAESNGPFRDLKAMRLFRTSWAKFSAEKRLVQAIARAPENAGPLNSHMLIIRSLEMMRDISPDYLNRFVSYADTLLWLEQAGGKIELAAEKEKTPTRKTKANSKK